MFNTKISVGDQIFVDVVFRNAHDNVTNVDIRRDPSNFGINIIFTIENTKKTKMIRDVQYLHNEDIKHFRLGQITHRANKYASFINEVPDYISDEQIVMWLNIRMRKL
jgi:hypothetical protein